LRVIRERRVARKAGFPVVVVAAYDLTSPFRAQIEGTFASTLALSIIVAAFACRLTSSLEEEKTRSTLSTNKIVLRIGRILETVNIFGKALLIG